MTPLAVGSRIGILGDGQLGRMLSCAAGMLGFDVVVFGPNDYSPASRVSSYAIRADYTDKDALAEFSVRTDLITLEFESVPVSAVQMLADIGKTVSPGAKSLEVCQDRHLEKSFARDHGVNTAKYWVIETTDDLREALNELNGRGILKTRQDGYDGHGQVRLKTGDSASEAMEKIRSAPAILEEMIPFSGELSVVIARSATGEVSAYEPSENIHRNGILHTSRVPARFSDGTKHEAVRLATRLVEALGHIGVLAVEFFVLDSGELLLNEMAPRVHNSGHWTPEACITGQFEQHIRAIAGWPLGPVDRLMNVEMVNLLGDDVSGHFGLRGPGAMTTLYGKRQARPGRKMGHVVKRN